MKLSQFLLLTALLAHAASIEKTISLLEMTDTSSSDKGHIAVAQNPLDRDEDKLPEDADDKGDETYEGDVDWVLVTSFKADKPGTGQVWVLPEDSDDLDDSFVLVGGLQTPTGVCFDKNHEFLYVCDPAARSVYQFEIDYDGSHTFVLASDQVATIYEGVAPVDCSIDAYGNLYVMDLGRPSIEFFDYVDLWSGLLNKNQTLYANLPALSLPLGIEVADSKTIYFVNSALPEGAGFLNSAPTYTVGENAGTVTKLIQTNLKGSGIGISEDYLYISGADGSLWTFDYEDPELKLKSAGTLKNPRGICAGDGTVYVADYELGGVYTVDDDDDSETPKLFARLEGAYGVACV